MQSTAKLKNYPTSPMKMRLLADEIRGKAVGQSLTLLENHPQHNATPLRKLLLSAISNWKTKNSSDEVEGLYVKAVFVDGGPVLKRMMPAPQGRAYRKKKRSNHVTIVVDKKNQTEVKTSDVKASQETKTEVVDKKTEKANKETKQAATPKKRVTKKSADQAQQPTLL